MLWFVLARTDPSDPAWLGAFCIGVFVLILLVAAASIWQLVRDHLAQRAEAFAFLEWIAREYRGSVDRGGWEPSFQITFPCRWGDALLWFEASKRGSAVPTTCLQIPWPFRDECLRVVTWGVPLRFGEFAGIDEYKTTDARFDNLFESKAADPRRAAELLNARSRRALTRLAGLAAGQALDWTIESRTMTLTKIASLSDREALTAFVADALELCAAALDGDQDEGVSEKRPA